MNNQKLRLGIIGAGNIAGVHASTFSKLSELCEIVAITDFVKARAQQLADQYSIPYVLDSTEAVIRHEEVDAVIIAVPNHLHADYAVETLEAGKHVLIEKPMAINSAEASRIYKASLQTNTISMVAHHMRFESVPMQLKQQIERGELGHIYYAKTGWFRRKGIPGWGTWFTKMEESGGGPLIDIGVHMLDLALFLMGNPKPVSVYGSTYAEFGPKRKGIGNWGTPDWNGKYDVEDLASALIKMEDGSTLSLEVSWAVHMDTDNRPFIHLMGSEGGASYKSDDGKLLTEKFDRPIETVVTKAENDEGERIRMAHHFLACIAEGKQPYATVLSGYTNNLILDAIYESSRTGNEVKLNWDILS